MINIKSGENILERIYFEVLSYISGVKHESAEERLVFQITNVFINSGATKSEMSGPPSQFPTVMRCAELCTGENMLMGKYALLVALL